jgi:dihydropyrimidinase
MYDLRIIHGRSYIDHEFKLKNIYINNDKIELISDELFEAEETIDAMHLLVLPGLIDPHVHLHLNIGSTYSSDDFRSGSRLAAYGGVTTLIDFLDPINSLDQLEQVYNRRRDEAKESLIDYSFHTTLGHFSGDVKNLITQSKSLGLTSIKVFTTYSDSDRRCPDEIISKLLNEDILVLAHAEDDEMIIPCDEIEFYEASRSEACELSAVRKLINQMSDDSRLYVVHMSSGQTLDQITLRKGLFIESCPQYFYLDKKLFLKEDGKKYLLAPPIRGEDSITKLREHIEKINSIGTDHCPFMSYEKMIDQSIDAIPKGIGSLGLAFQLMYDMFGDKVIKKFTSEPASIFNLRQKGEIKVGYDADFAIIDPKGQTECDHVHSNVDYTVYPGMVLNTEVKVTVSRGNIIMSNGEIHDSKGQFIRRHL